jgi:hypothetical protein
MQTKDVICTSNGVKLSPCDKPVCFLTLYSYREKDCCNKIIHGHDTLTQPLVSFCLWVCKFETKTLSQTHRYTDTHTHTHTHTHMRIHKESIYDKVHGTKIALGRRDHATITPSNCQFYLKSCAAL